MAATQTIPESKFKFGDIVFLITDPQQEERIVTGWIVRPMGISYYLLCGTLESLHYDFEIGTDKDWKKI